MTCQIFDFHQIATFDRSTACTTGCGRAAAILLILGIAVASSGYGSRGLPLESHLMRLVTPRLLITDDDRDFRETVAGLLSDRGFETLQAGDGEEALELVGKFEVHLLLLDMHMPRLSGL